MVEQEFEVLITQVLVHYAPEELARWRQGDPTFVPAKVLAWNGPGRENGYGFAEFVAERYLRTLGHEVITNDFDIISKESKYAANNARIEATMGRSAYLNLQKALRMVLNSGMRIEQPDICVLGPEKVFFAEAKRDRDYLRPPQKLFAVLLSAIFNLSFVVYKILPHGNEYNLSPILVRENIPCEWIAKF